MNVQHKEAKSNAYSQIQEKKDKDSDDKSSEEDVQ